MKRLLIALACCYVVVVAGGVPPGNSGTPSTLQLLQDRLNELGRAMLASTGALQSAYGELTERLNKQLVVALMGAYWKLEDIHRTTGQFIKNYNMTDAYCMEVVGYLYWAHAEEAVQSMQACAVEVVDAVDGTRQKRLADLLEQARVKGAEVTMVVVRELAKGTAREEVEHVVAGEVDRIKAEWLQTEQALEEGLGEFATFRDATVGDTEQCTQAVIDQYSLHMGYIEFYLNKNKNCRR